MRFLPHSARSEVRSRRDVQAESCSLPIERGVDQKSAPGGLQTKCLLASVVMSQRCQHLLAGHVALWTVRLQSIKGELQNGEGNLSFFCSSKNYVFSMKSPMLLFSSKPAKLSTVVPYFFGEWVYNGITHHHSP